MEIAAYTFIPRICLSMDVYGRKYFWFKNTKSLKELKVNINCH